MKNKKYNTVGTIPNPIDKSYKEATLISLTQRQDRRSLPCLGTSASIKSGGFKQVSRMMLFCNYFPHMSKHVIGQSIL